MVPKAECVQLLSACKFLDLSGFAGDDNDFIDDEW